MSVPASAHGAGFAVLMSSQVRVRFAPSPTGLLHVGGARTALFNWLFARHMGGKFVLRIEDTDRARHVEEAVQVILAGMRWLGLDWDEGPEAGGGHAPYFQSERGAIYEGYLKKLEATGKVYVDAAGATRFQIPRQPLEFDDMVCGHIAVDRSKTTTPTGEPEADMTIRRADGSWIFHFVNVVDDAEMEITHVIRGEDHLSNTPKHLELFAALGVAPPVYGHIPLILNRDGSKMSKRDQGASITNYMEQGYVPAAVRNYLCLLGWSPKDDREKLEIDEVIRLFDPAKINRKAAHFDLEKCNWLNWQYVVGMDLEQFAEASIPWVDKAGIKYESKSALLPVLGLPVSDEVLKPLAVAHAGPSRPNAVIAKFKKDRLVVRSFEERGWPAGWGRQVRARFLTVAGKLMRELGYLA